MSFVLGPLSLVLCKGRMTRDKGQRKRSSPSRGETGCVPAQTLKRPARTLLCPARQRCPGVYRSGQTGQTVNLMAYAFEGSNPSAPNSVHPHLAPGFTLHWVPPLWDLGIFHFLPNYSPINRPARRARRGRRRRRRHGTPAGRLAAAAVGGVAGRVVGRVVGPAPMVAAASSRAVHFGSVTTKSFPALGSVSPRSAPPSI